MTAAAGVSWAREDYRLMGPFIVLEVRGLPVPQGSIRSLGKGRPSIHSNAARLKPWREHVQTALEDEMRRNEERFGGRGSSLCPWPIEGPVAIDVTFTMSKPKSAPKRRRTFPITRPDLDKLIRAIGDAATAAGVWRDDSQVVQQATQKVFPGEARRSLEVPGALIFVYTVRGGEQ